MRQLLLAAILLTSCCQSTERSSATFIPNVWLIDSWIASGSACPIAQEKLGDEWVIYFLTAKHVVDGMDLSAATLINGEVFLKPEAEALVHPTLDAALVLVKSQHPVYTHQLGPHPDVGAMVTTVGFGGGNDRWASLGLISDTGRSTCPIFPGDSGGGVFDQYGRLVGIPVQMGAYNRPLFGPTIAFHHMRFVPIDSIRGWLSEQHI